MVTRRQLLDLGFTPKAIEHRLSDGRLHRLHAGVYAVGRPEVTQRGRWMAAVLACGPGSALSHGSAAALWGFGEEHGLHVTVPPSRAPRRGGITVHRRALVAEADVTIHDHIPVTTPAATLMSLSTVLKPRALEAAVNDADRLGLITPDALRAGLDGRPGTAALRAILDRHTFSLTDSELERRFLRLCRKAGLPRPMTQQHLLGYRVDFHWPDLRLVVETDGLRYHRTPAQQAKDRRRDQALTAAGLIVLRFTHAQVRYEPGYVEALLRRMGR